MKQRGLILVNTLVFASIATIILVGLTSWFGVTITSARDVVLREQAFQIAEAGVDYYRWHLAHWPSDYQDGTATSGPYAHQFYNRAGEHIGDFALTITPPPSGSTIVTVESTGSLVSNPAISRSVRVQLAIPSWAKFAVVSNSDVRFGVGTEVFGPIHSNGGIRFDGLAHNVITSARTSYDDPDHSGGNEFGVHTHVSPTDPLPPSVVPVRLDVFEAGRTFPVPSVDFNGITSDLATMKALAQSGGQYFAASGGIGYRMLLQTNDTFLLYRVNSVTTPHSSCTNVNNETGWGTWTVNTETYLGTYAFPLNGIIFLEDHVWVSGQINTARISIVAGRFPDTPANRRNIIFTNDILYTNYNGTDVIALIAQNNILTGMASLSTLRVDAALIAQYGTVGRYYYRAPYWSFGNRPGCSPYHERTQLTLYGMIGSNLRYGFAFTDGTGYDTRIINYDANLLYAPPPEFPLTTDQYQVISWEEIE